MACSRSSCRNAKRPNRAKSKFVQPDASEVIVEAGDGAGVAAGDKEGSGETASSAGGGIGPCSSPVGNADGWGERVDRPSRSGIGVTSGAGDAVVAAGDAAAEEVGAGEGLGRCDSARAGDGVGIGEGPIADVGDALEVA